jgi:predicted transcriptional regulator
MPTLNRHACEQLDRIRDVFGVSEHELAALFRVQRQSVTEWRENGVPRARVASVERLVDLANVFAREIIETRIPEIVRTEDDWLPRKTVLETIKSDGPEPIYGYLRHLFAYSGG